MKLKQNAMLSWLGRFRILLALMVLLCTALPANLIFVRDASADTGTKGTACVYQGQQSDDQSGFFGSQMCLGPTDSTHRFYQFVVKFTQSTPNATVTFKNKAGNTKGTFGYTTPSAFKKIDNTHYVSQPSSAGTGYGVNIDTCDQNTANITITVKNNDTGVSDSQGYNICNGATDYTHYFNFANGGTKSAPPTTGTIKANLEVCRPSDFKSYTDPSTNQKITAHTVKIDSSGLKSITLKDLKTGKTQTDTTRTASWYTLSNGVLSIPGETPDPYSLQLVWEDHQLAGTSWSRNYTFTNKSFQVTSGPSWATSSTKFDCALMVSSDPDAGPSTGNSNDTPTCESSGGLSWILCSIFNGLADVSDFMMKDLVQPLLLTQPIDTSSSGSTYQVWSNFRVYGDVFLVIALLVVVFGQSIGGGMIDAYTAKKVLPRLLIAAILINLSLYIVALMIDITNIIGAGVGSLLTAPLKDAGQFHFSLSGAQEAGISLGASLGIGAFITTLLVAHGPLLKLAGDAIPFIMLFVIMPIVFSLIAAVCTIIIRKGLILFLVMVSPVAFALYCLPNTEKYFKQWWDLLFKTMLVYPIIMVLFAVADILSVTIMQANNLGSTPLLNQSIGGTAGTVVAATSTNILAALLALVALFLPLFMIPFSFRMAGGLLGRIHEVATNTHKKMQEGIKGNPNDPFSMRNMARRRAGNRVLSIRENAIGAGVNMQKGNSRVGRFVGRRIAGIYGSGNYEVRRSLRNKEAADMIASQVSTGGDATVRAAFATQGTDGKWRGTNGTEYTRSQVDKARQLVGKDQSMYQAALTYELGKSSNDDELSAIRAVNLANMSRFGFKFDEGNIWTGAAYSHQQDRRELKHTKLENGLYTRNGHNFTREVAENVGNYPLSNMRTSTIDALIDDHAAASAYLTLSDASSTPEQIAEAQKVQRDLVTKSARTGVVQKGFSSREEAQRTKDYVTATANSLSARGPGYALAGEEGSQAPVSGTASGAPGLVNQKIDELVAKAGTRNRGTQGPPNPPAGGGGPTTPPTVSGGPNRGGVLLG